MSVMAKFSGLARRPRRSSDIPPRGLCGRRRGWPSPTMALATTGVATRRRRCGRLIGGERATAGRRGRSGAEGASAPGPSEGRGGGERGRSIWAMGRVSECMAAKVTWNVGAACRRVSMYVCTSQTRGGDGGGDRTAPKAQRNGITRPWKGRRTVGTTTGDTGPRCDRSSAHHRERAPDVGVTCLQGLGGCVSLPVNKLTS